MKSRSILFASLFLVVNLFIAAVALLIACSNTDEFYTVEVVDGVRIVHNIKPLWGDEPMVELEFVQQIGSLDETDENLMMYFIWDVERDEDGNIYILDSGNVRIQKYGSEGEYISTIGRKGEGPGEFGGPLSINLDDEGNIYVGYYNNRNMISVFNKDGSEIRRFRNPGQNHPRLRLLNSGQFILGGSWVMGRLGDDTNLYKLYSIFDMDGTINERIGTPIFAYSSNSLFIDLDAPFAVTDEGDIIYTSRYSNIIEEMDGKGSKMLVVDRRVSFEVGSYNYKDNIPVAPNTVSMELEIDHKQRIWVLTLTEQPEKWDGKGFLTLKSVARFELFDSEGILLGYVPVPQDVYRMRIKGDRLLIVEGQQVSVFEYRIVEK